MKLIVKTVVLKIITAKAEKLLEHATVNTLEPI